MKRQLLSLFALGSLAALLAAPLHAQNNNPVTFRVPFDFMVGDKAFPAGSYTVTPVSQALQISDAARKVVATVLPMTIYEKTLTKQPTLRFRLYGDTHFLSQVWLAGRTSGHQLTQSGREHQLARGANPAIESITAQR
jgi:hypothetical protein